MTTRFTALDWRELEHIREALVSHREAQMRACNAVLVPRMRPEDFGVPLIDNLITEVEAAQ